MISKFECSDGRVVHAPLTFVNAIWNYEKDVTNIDVRGAFNLARCSGPLFVPLGPLFEP